MTDLPAPRRQLFQWVRAPAAPVSTRRRVVTASPAGSSGRAVRAKAGEAKVRSPRSGSPRPAPGDSRQKTNTKAKTTADAKTKTTADAKTKTTADAKAASTAPPRRRTSSASVATGRGASGSAPRRRVSSASVPTGRGRAGAGPRRRPPGSAPSAGAAAVATALAPDPRPSPNSRPGRNSGPSRNPRSSASPAPDPMSRARPQTAQPGPEAAPHLRVVGARPRLAWSGRSRARVLCFAASIAAIVVAFGLVYLHVLSAQKQFKIDHLTQVETQAQANYEQLRVSVESLNSPARVMAAATALGMHEPASVTVIKGVGPVGSPEQSVVRKGAKAPGGVADYSDNKSNLAGTP